MQDCIGVAVRCGARLHGFRSRLHAAAIEFLPYNMGQCWGAALDAGPSTNPAWAPGAVPFRLLARPPEKLWPRIERPATRNPWTSGGHGTAAPILHCRSR